MRVHRSRSLRTVLTRAAVVAGLVAASWWGLPVASQAADPAPAWGAAPSVLGTGHQFDIAAPQVLLASDGIHATALWVDAGALRLKSGMLDGGAMSWGVTVPLGGSGATMPSLALSADGATAVATWFDAYPNAHVRIGRIAGTQSSWSADDTLTPQSGNSLLVDGAPVSLSDDGTRVTMAWVEAGASAGVYSRCGRIADGVVTWGATTRVSGADIFVSGPQILSSADGLRVAVVYRRNTYTTPTLRTNRAVISPTAEPLVATWQGTAAVSSDTTRDSFSAAMSADGSRVAVAWLDATSSAIVSTKVAALVGGNLTWSPQSSHAAAPDAGNPSVAVTGDGGRILLAWEAGMVSGRATAIVSQSASVEATAVSWDDSKVLGTSPLMTLGSAALSRDGARAAVSWSTSQQGAGSGSVPTEASLGPRRWESSTHELVAVAVVDGSGVHWQTPQFVSDDTTLNGPPNMGQRVGISADGTRVLASWVENTQEPSGLFANSAVWPAPGPAPLPAPPVPAGPPTSARAELDNGAAVVSWLPPESPGSFPATNYRVTSTPGGRVCVTTALTCRFDNLSYGVPYSFSISALTGAGWGADAYTTSVTRVAVVVSAARSRERVVVSGDAAPDQAVTIWIRVGTATDFRPAARAVRTGVDGHFTWERRTPRAIALYAESASGRSNTVVLPRVRNR